MATQAQLEAVKVRIGETGPWNGGALSGIIDDTIAYALSAGVSEDTLNSDKALGVIARGVADQWNFGGGKGVFSDVFKMRLVQLMVEDDYSGGDDPVSDSEGI